MPKILANNSQAVTFDSEEELEFALNNSVLPTRWTVAGKGGKFTLIGVDSGIVISPEAAEVLANMPVSLTGAEQMAVIQFVNTQSVALGSGNWSKIDAFAHGKLSNAANKLWKWKANGAMVNNGSVLGVDGWGFNGVDQYIDSGFNPSVDGINYLESDAILGVFAETNPTPSSGKMLIGAVQTSQVRIRTSSATVANGVMNNSFYNNTQSLDSNELWVLSATGANGGYYINGLPILVIARTFVGVPSESLFIGAQHKNGSADFLWEGVISSFVIGGGIGFNHTDFYTNLVALNAAL